MLAADAAGSRFVELFDAALLSTVPHLERSTGLRGADSRPRGWLSLVAVLDGLDAVDRAFGVCAAGSGGDAPAVQLEKRGTQR